ncbi:hypothetical protein [Humidesulfovibrio sp.]
MSLSVADTLRVVPLYPRPDESFWLEDSQAREFLSAKLGFWAAQGETLVATNSPLGAELAASVGTRALIITQEDDPGYLPLGAVGALRLVSTERPKANLVLADFRLAGDLAGLAARMSQPGSKTGQVQASVSTPQDHPVQFMQNASFVGIIAVHLFEGSEQVAGTPCWRTRPCRLLPPHGVMSSEGYWLAQSLSGSVPVPAEDCARALSDGEVLATFNSGHCTLFFPKDALARRAFGQPPLGASLLALNGPQAILVATRTGCELRFSETPSGCDAVLLPRTVSGHIHEQCHRAAPTIPLCFVPQDDVLPLLLLQCSDAGYGDLGRTDLRLPFSPDDNLWADAEGNAFTPTTGESIFGRQQFPPCQEVDGMMFSGTADDLLCFEELLFDGKVAGVQAGAAGTGKVRRIANKLDFLCHCGEEGR